MTKLLAMTLSTSLLLASADVAHCADSPSISELEEKAAKMNPTH